jgi:Tfp pilus assembly protein PilO
MSRRAVLFAAIAAVAVLALWYVALWNPTHSSLNKAKQRTEAAQAQEAQLRAAVDRLRAQQKDEPLQRAKLETLRTAIPDTPNLAQFILDANDAATKSGIDFISIAPGLPVTPTAAPGTATTPTTAAGATTTTVAGGAITPTTAAPATVPAQISLALQIKGGYFQVLDFLNRLDKLPRLVVTDSVNIATDPNGGLTVGLSGRMFLRSIPAGFPGGAATTTTVASAGTTTTTAAGGATTTTAAGGTGVTTTTAAGGRP